jgi:transcriptional regulator with XRE-family HTH domain
LRLVPLRLKAQKPKETDFEAQTLGQHARKRRLLLKLTQRQAALRLGVSAATVRNWEKGRTKPPIESMPAIVAFLGYAPLQESTSIAGQLLAKRWGMGWSIRKAAAAVGVDPATWADWEHGKVILFRKHRTLVSRLLGQPCPRAKSTER